ncbi:ASCH domain-containing protein [Candidatus Binatus sp.]|uniref:ASCH domain-containing protein n=1 Tax=Candidatus Binatus sp. TaxID=2811406 RepID=UPI0039C8A80C
MIPVIPLSGEFVPLVLSGRKISTVRLKRRPYTPGPAILRSRDVEIPITVTTVRNCNLRDLNDADARKDGFESIGDLHSVLQKIYGNLEPDQEVAVLEFSLR